ncbi:hypothetical protein [Actinoplanes sp. NBRC 101535]|uniref:hypothetical protein n=1 Tax=Actinoplanes sp. NBRC 101535 TaxID=3032196 RepID=UPI0024A5AC5C|nr:hypothetical protein [Actinoplanes sp. NBRC 101535]GLY07992.1 hypothetical protein Acsp01_83710 [Actinoplanes sp. NBRC 101535]
MISQTVRWAALTVAALTMLVFLGSQRSDFEVSYARSPAGGNGKVAPAGTVTLPSVEEMTRLVRASPVVRLPGTVARWDTARVDAAIGDSGLRILAVPPGLDEASTERLRAVEAADLRIIGTAVTLGTISVGGSTLADWRDEFATADVTNSLLLLIADLRDQPAPAMPETLRWREPAAAETAVVAADLRAGGFHRAEGAALEEAPQKSTAFPDGRVLYVALPVQPLGKPVPEYGPALAKLFPDTPIVVMYGGWIEYSGPFAGDFADIAAAGFYSQAASVMERSAYTQRGVLETYLQRVTEIRFAGIFDRPLPYQPPDPLRVALPALPWIFVLCVLLFVVISARPILLPAGPQVARLIPGTLAQLAALTALAVEMSALADQRSETPLARALVSLTAARDAVDADLPDAHVRAMLRNAEIELDRAARLLPYRGYRPAEYLRGRLA